MVKGKTNSLRLISNTFLMSIIAVPVFTMPTMAATAKNNDEILEEVVVTGYRGSVQNALEMKRDADKVVDAISAEDMGKFPDQNLAESLQRVPGVSISRENGEGNRITVRGLGPLFNRVTINGRTATSASGGSRSFDFKALSSDIISRVEVFKTPTADMSEGGVGGTVDIHTAKPLDIGKSKAVVSAKGTYDDLADNTDPHVAALVSEIFNDGKLGVILAGSWSTRGFRQDNYNQAGQRFSPRVSTFLGRDVREAINVVPQLSIGEQTRANFAGTLQFQPNDNLEIIVEGILSNLDKEQDQYSLAIPPQRGGISVSGAQASPDGTLTFLRVENGFSNSNVRRFDNEDKLRSYSTTVNWNKDNWTVSGNLAYSKSTSTGQTTQTIIDIPRNIPGVPNTIEFDWRNGVIPEITSSFDVTDYSAQIYRHGSITRTDLTDEETSFKFDVDYAFNDTGVLTSVESGLNIRSRRFLDAPSRADRTVFARSQVAIDGASNAPGNLPAGLEKAFPVDDYMRDEGGNIIRTWAVFDAEALADYFAPPGGFMFEPNNVGFGKVDEDIYAAYVKLNFEGGNDLPWSGNFGVRYVSTDQSSQGYASEIVGIDTTSRPGDPFFTFGGSELTESSRTYSAFLWSANLKLDLTDNQVLRFAAAEVMSRPNFGLLSPSVSSVNGAFRTMTRGNPELEPFKATQFDIIYELYFEEFGAATAGAFYKDIETIFQTLSSEVDFTFEGTTFPFSVTQPQNSKGGSLYGLEAAYSTSFHWLPKPFDGFGIITNYTFADSDIETINPVISDRSFSLEGLSKHNANATLFYENNNFSGRASYNYRSDFLLQTVSEAQNTLFRDSYGQWDASFSYSVNDTYSVVLEGINLTDERSYSFFDFPNRASSVSYFGRRFSLGVRAKF